MIRGLRSGVRSARGGAFAAAIATLAVATRAQAATMETRKVAMTWDKDGVLHGVLPYRDALEDKTIQRRLDEGLPVTLVMRGYVIPSGGGDPIALTARSCNITWQIWDEVWYVAVNGGKRTLAINKSAIYRKCIDEDQIIVARKTLPSASTNYRLVVRVEVNPVSEEMLKQIQSWVTRPTGSSGAITPGDALFSSFVGVFMKKAVTADKIVEFQTDPLPP